MARHRIEDIGRILAMIEALLENDLFVNSCWPHEISEEEKKEFLKFQEGDIELVADGLYRILDICKGTDPLNYQDPNEELYS